jgi:hypothetical protein
MAGDYDVQNQPDIGQCSLICVAESCLRYPTGNWESSSVFTACQSVGGQMSRVQGLMIIICFHSMPQGGQLSRLQGHMIYLELLFSHLIENYVRVFIAGMVIENRSGDSYVRDLNEI